MGHLFLKNLFLPHKLPLIPTNRQPTHHMKQEDIFQIQTEQLLDEIKFIEFIAENKEQIIKNLFTKVSDENAKYFSKVVRYPDTIFRGDRFRQYINWYYRNQTKQS